jgi:tetratricopeptide (TPR) repeat protein
LLLGWLPAIALLLSVAVARGDARSSGQAHLQRGLALYQKGQYRAAIAQFEAGYATLPRAAFLLDIAQSWRQLGRLVEARAYYLRFLAEVSPRDPTRTQVLALVDKIDAQLRASHGDTPPATQNAPPPNAPPAKASLERAPTTTPPPAPSPAPLMAPAPAIVAAPTTTPPPSRATRRRAGWAGVGLAALGLAGLGVGVSFAVLADRADTELAHPANGTVYDPRVYDRRELDRGLAIGFLVAGSTLALGGTLLAALGLRTRADRDGSRARF